MDNKETIAVLNDLVQITNDRLEIFRNFDTTALYAYPGLHAEYDQMLIQTEKMKSELSALILGKGGDIGEPATFAGGIHKAWVDLKNSLRGDRAESTLKNVLNAEKSAIKAFEKVLESGDLDARSSEVVQDQLQQLRITYQKFNKLAESIE